MPSNAPQVDKSDFRRTTAKCPQRRNQTSFDSVRGKAAGKQSWAKRSLERKELTTLAMRAALDPRRGGQVMAELCKDPQFLLEREVTRLRSEAIERGEMPPMYYRIEPYDEPVTIKRPGRMRRKRAERGIS
jgi:hypothetical protein